MLGLAILSVVMPASVHAQAPPGHAHELGRGGLAFGGEITAIVSPADEHAYFNYTDYDRDGLRMARVRLFGEWHLVDRLSIVGEVRTENADHVSAPAFFVRWQPSAAHPVSIQAGRIPPVTGGHARRAYGRDNLVFGEPLAYQYLTSLRPDALPGTRADLLAMRARGWQPSYPLGSQALRPGLPLASASSWDTGVQLAWEPGAVSLAGAVTRGSPAAPVVRETNGGLMWSGRTAVTLPPGVTIGVSGARGEWLSDQARAAAGLAGLDAMQSLLALDAEYGSGPVLVRAEWMRSTFGLPMPGEARPLALGASAVFAEGRYRMHPRLQIGLRAEHLGFSTIALTPGGTATLTWDAPVDRLEVAAGVRATRQLEVRVGWQHNWREGGRVRERGVPVAGAYYWF
jgi:hypothetical protein